MIQKPLVTLFSMTENPLMTIMLGIQAWHSFDLPSSIKSSKWTEEECIEKFLWLLKQPHQTPLEFVNTVWVLKNVSRAFQQQLTRHRIGFSYSIQSLRVVNQDNFAEEGRFHIPNTIKNKSLFFDNMIKIQKMYNDAIEVSGESIEDARGLLPLNIYSPITMACSYRSLLGLLRQRICVAAQEEWREVTEQMRQQLEIVHPILAVPIDCSCKRYANNGGVCKVLHKKVDTRD